MTVGNCVICDIEIKEKDEVNVDYMYEDEDLYCMSCAEVEGDTGFVY